MDKALLELWRPNPKPEESVKMFLMAVNDFNGSPDLGDYCAYAYASGWHYEKITNGIA